MGKPFIWTNDSDEDTTIAPREIIRYNPIGADVQINEIDLFGNDNALYTIRLGGQDPILIKPVAPISLHPYGRLKKDDAVSVFVKAFDNTNAVRCICRIIGREL